MSFHATQTGAPGDTVRPEPGLARGPFAAPPLFFYAVLVLTALALAFWFWRQRRTAKRRSEPH